MTGNVAVRDRVLEAPAATRSGRKCSAVGTASAKSACKPRIQPPIHSRRSRWVISSSRAIAAAASDADRASSATYFEELELVVEDFAGADFFLVGVLLVTVGAGVVVGAVAAAGGAFGFT